MHTTTTTMTTATKLGIFRYSYFNLCLDCANANIWIKFIGAVLVQCTVSSQLQKIGIENLSRNSSVNYCFKSISICQKSKPIWNYINECYKRICFDANCWSPTTWAAFSISISFARYLIGTYCWLETFEMNATTRHFIFCHVNTQSVCDCKPRRPNKRTGAQTLTLLLSYSIYLVIHCRNKFRNV